MSLTLATDETQPAPPAPGGVDSLKVHPLRAGGEAEALAFLAQRPLHTVIMAGFIRDNGLESPLNRGSFYACRDREGRVEGILLAGHATLMEARTQEAVEAFGRLGRSLPRPHVILGEEESVARFWRSYAGEGAAPRLSCRELLLEQREPAAARTAARGLRPATVSDLDAVVETQARMAFEECGVDPRRADPEGFRGRCRRRIELGRVWVLAEGGRLDFKADVISDTPEVVYLEGVHVDRGRRGVGLGLDCLAALGRALLAKAGSVCLMVKESNHEARAFYRRAGYEFRCHYDTVYPA